MTARESGARRIAATVLALGVLTVVFVLLPVTARADTNLGCPRGAMAGDARVAATVDSRLTGKMHGYLRATHIACARVIARTVRGRGLTVRAAAIAITSTIVESAISNLDYGMGTSVGLYQQIDAWGSVAQRTDPVWATNTFINTMLRRYPDGSWATRPIGEVCQAVQRSAFPERFQPEAADGTRIATALWNPARPVAPHDFSGDGVADLIGITTTGELRYYPDNINVQHGIPFNAYVVTGRGWTSMVRVLVGDFSGDGVADLLGVTRTGELRYYPNNLNVTGVPFSRYVVTGQGWATMTRVLVGDFSGDGVADLVGTTPGGELRYYPNNLTITGVPFSRYVVTGQGWGTVNPIVAGDFSGDGVADLLGVTRTGELRYYPNNLNVTGVPFSRYVVTGQGWATMTRVLAGDFSGDGVADLVGTTPGGELRYYPNNLTITGVPFSRYVVTGQGWATMTRVLAGDFSSDGVADLVGTTPGGELRYYPNNLRITRIPFTSYVVTGRGWNGIVAIP